MLDVVTISAPFWQWSLIGITAALVVFLLGCSAGMYAERDAYLADEERRRRVRAHAAGRSELLQRERAERAEGKAP